MTPDQLREVFQSHFGYAPLGIVRAPGRVNLIGEHTDYNDGFVLPIAINKRILAAFGATDQPLLRLRSLQEDGAAEVRLDEPIQPGPPRWTNYPRGVAAGLAQQGVRLSGADLLFDSDVPLGAGLSSSAALEVATAMALLERHGQASHLSGPELALLCQQAEHRYAGAPCGIMDQSIATMAQAGRAMLLDCRSGHIEHVPFNDPSVVLLVADTQVKHAISDGGYAARRDQCHAAAAKLGANALRDVSMQALASAQARDTLSQKEFMRARHVVGEIARTLEACQALRAGDYGRFGGLMLASHASLRDDYEVSCPELDVIVDSATAQPGVYGARMTGGGFGGSAIILCRAGSAEAVAKAVQQRFAQSFGRSCPVFATAAEAGAGLLRE